MLFPGLHYTAEHEMKVLLWNHVHHSPTLKFEWLHIWNTQLHACTQIRVKLGTAREVRTRQMMIIAGVEPELCCGMVLHGMLSERVMHYVCASLVQKTVCTCVEVWKRVCVKWLAKKTDVGESQEWWHQQGSTSMKRFAGLSLIPASQFVARVSLLFAFPSSAFSVL